MKTSYDDIGRIYHTPNGKYYSVTTMLSMTGDKTFLDDWKKRIGEHEAKLQTERAASVGSAFHELGEAYLLGHPMPLVQPLAKIMFKTAIPILDKHVTRVEAVEEALYSNVLQLAGRTDAILDWDKKLAVFDYKCIGHNNPEWLEDYWIQTTIYGQMYKELTGIQVKKLVLVCANKKTFKVKAFEEDPKKYAKKAVERIKLFRKMLTA